MSSEFVPSETTPLRRPENISDRINNFNNNNNNNNNIDREDRLIESSEIINRNEIYQSDNNKMDCRNQLLWKVKTDFVILLCVGFPILFFFIWGEPYERGFFCDDNSLHHPFHESTIKNWMLYIVGLILPIAIIVVTEIIQNRNGNSTSPKYKLLNFTIPPWVADIYKQVGVFGFGAAASQLVVDIAKYSIGRLRPHFFSVCQPIMPDGTNCTNPINIGKYIENFKCIGFNSSARMLKEMRLSFPSGHSSFSAFTMIYCAIYLHSRMTWHGSKLLKHFIQFLLVMMAWYTALSRVSDYKHHWSDALAGSVIGIVCALIVANYVSDLCQRQPAKEVLPISRHEMISAPTNGRV